MHGVMGGGARGFLSVAGETTLVGGGGGRQTWVQQSLEPHRGVSTIAANIITTKTVYKEICLAQLIL